MTMTENRVVAGEETGTRPEPQPSRLYTNPRMSLEESGPNRLPSERSAWPLGAALQRLGELRQIRANWDGEESPPPSEWSAALARGLLLEANLAFGAAAGERIRPFAVAPMSGGGVHIEWRSPWADLEVEITNDPRLGYLFTDKRGAIERSEEDDGVVLGVILARLEQVLVSPA